MTNKMQLCRVVYYSMAALHVSSDNFTHHQEHLNCITASGITHVCRIMGVLEHSVFFPLLGREFFRPPSYTLADTGDKM